MESVIRELYEEATQKHYETEIQYNIAKKIASVHDLSEMHHHKTTFESIANDIKKLLKAENCIIFLRGYEGDDFHVAGATSMNPIDEVQQTLETLETESSTKGEFIKATC